MGKRSSSKGESCETSLAISLQLKQVAEKWDSIAKIILGKLAEA